MAFVVAFDVSSTRTGVAWGNAGGKPETTVWTLAGKTRRARLAALFARAAAFLKVYPADLVVIEKPLDPAVGVDRGTTVETYLSLMGGAVIVEMVAELRQVPRVELVGVQDIRAHFLGRRRFAKGYDVLKNRATTSRAEAKRATVNMCHMRGWKVASDDAADAAAAWSYGCALLDPRLAALATPLFVKGVA